MNTESDSCKEIVQLIRQLIATFADTERKIWCLSSSFVFGSDMSIMLAGSGGTEVSPVTTKRRMLRSDRFRRTWSGFC